MLHSEPRAFSDPELRHWGAPGSWAGKLGFGTPEGLPDNPLPQEAQALHISTLCSLQTTHLYPSAHKLIQVPGFDPPHCPWGVRKQEDLLPREGCFQVRRTFPSTAGGSLCCSPESRM